MDPKWKQINGLIPMDTEKKKNHIDNNEMSAYASESVCVRSICDVCRAGAKQWQNDFMHVFCPR